MASAPQSISYLLPMGRPGAWGSDAAPPRQLYFTLIPAILALCGILSWIMGDQAGLIQASFVASIVGFYSLWEWLFRNAPTRFSTLMAIALLLGYGFGTVNTWATLPRGSLSLADVWGLREGVLARGLGAVLISAALLYFFGEIFEKPIFGREFRLEIDGRTRALVFVGMLAMVAGYATHSLVFERPAVGQGHVSAFGVFLSWLYMPITCLAVAALMTAPHLRARLWMGFSALLLLLMLSVLGRRAAIYTSAEVIFLLGLMGYRWRANFSRTVLIVAGLITVIAVCSLTFMLLRISGTLHRKQHPSIERRIQVAQTLMEKGQAFEIATTTSRRNVESRTFVVAFLANVLDASLHRTPALGRDLVMNLEVVVPSAIYPQKMKHISETEEELDDQQFGLAYGDEANSVLTAGATDFGLIGMLLYPLIMMAIVRFCYNFFTVWFKGIPLLTITLSLIATALLTETELSGYFVTLRNEILFGVLIALFMAFPRIRLRTGIGAVK